MHIYIYIYNFKNLFCLFSICSGLQPGLFKKLFEKHHLIRLSTICTSPCTGSLLNFYVWRPVLIKIQRLGEYRYSQQSSYNNLKIKKFINIFQIIIRRFLWLSTPSLSFLYMTTTPFIAALVDVRMSGLCYKNRAVREIQPILVR